MNCLGDDVTQQYWMGAKKALDIAQRHNCTVAVLKARSPSCGSRRIYDGTFSGVQIPSQGVAAQLLAQAGIRVLDEEELESGTLEQQPEFQ